MKFLKGLFIALVLVSCFGVRGAFSDEANTGSVYRLDEAGRDVKYSVTFRNADLKDALSFIAKVANINIMVPEDVGGVVSASFEETYLRDAINSIVKANNLDYAVERGIWRIGKTEQFTTSGEDLKTETFRLKYASAKDLTDKVQGLLTDRGSVLADERTNSLVVKERPANIDSVRRFLEDIDVRDAQVLIEAKIVEATRDFSRNLGVQWGVTSTGTRVNLQGLNAVGAADSGRNLVQNMQMPTTASVSAPTSGLGMIIGSLAGGTTLDMQISAAEQSGDINIVSEPTIVTSNGVAANIRSGETIYVKTTGDIAIGATGGTSTSGGSSGLESVETGIELRVTPQISVDNYIKLKIDIETSQLDFTRTVEGIPVLVDSNASTSVVIRDGETTVIGGLAKLTGSKTKKNVPGFSKIPLFGNLFKSRARYKQHKELMVFIKPTIVRNTYDIPQNAQYERVEEIRQSLMIPPEGTVPVTNKRVSPEAASRNKYLKYRE